MKANNTFTVLSAISALFLCGSVGLASGDKVIFQVRCFETAPKSPETWTKIITVVRGPTSSLLTVTPLSEHMTVTDMLEKKNEKQIVFLSSTADGAIYSWPFTVTSTGGSGHERQDRYKAVYRKADSSGFTIVADEQ